MLIRLATPADHEPVGDLTVAAYTEFLLGPDDPYAPRLRNTAVRAAEAEIWVAEEAGSVLGSVTVCWPGSPWREIATEREGEFRMLAVAPHARRRGVGDALVVHTLETFAAAGFTAMVLSTLPQMTGAHRIYERHGFVRAPARDWSPMPQVTLIAYACSLPG